MKDDPGGRPSRISTRGATADCLFLAAVTVLSLALYVFRVGFYFDDHFFLGLLATSPDQSLPGLLDAFREGSPKQNLRPAQEVLFSGLYRLFGLDPGPWHATNAVLLVAMVVLLYALLRELSLPRWATVSIPLVYALLPHYSSVRFWPATFAETLSMALLFLSLLALLRALTASAALVPIWLAVAGGALVISMLTYETAMPLFLLAPALVVYRKRQLGGLPGRRPAVISLAFGLVLLVTVAWKFAEAREISSVTGYDVGYENGLPYHIAYLLQGILRVNVGAYALGLPYVVGWILVNRLDWLVLGLALVVGLGSFGYLRRLERSGRAGTLERSTALRLFGAGVVVLALGYAIFLTNSEILFRSAGIDNRVAIAAAIGVAMCAVGGAAWLGARFAGRHSALVFRSVIAVLVAAGFLVVNTLANYWATAWERQQALIADLRRELPPAPGRLTVLLSGVCPEVGPAVVFASTTDLTGALKARYRVPTLAAAVVRDELLFERRRARIVNTFLGEVSSVLDFPYGSELFVYNAAAGRLFPLRDRADARRYVAVAPPSPSCPPVRSFAWGVDIDRWRFFA